MINKDVAYFAARHDLSAVPILPTAGRRLAVSEQHYDLPVELEVVFEAYRTAPPWEVWPARRLEFQQALAPGSTTAIREGDPWPNLFEGLRIFSNLSLQPVGLGFLRLYVGVEVTPGRDGRGDSLRLPAGVGDPGLQQHALLAPGPGRDPRPPPLRVPRNLAA